MELHCTVIGGWAQTHTHAHKHRICFHKSPVIPLLRAPEKVRQLPPISKRRKNLSVNEYVHVQGQLSGKTPHTCSLCGSSFPMSFSTWVILPNPSFTPQRGTLSTCAGLRVLLARLRLVLKAAEGTCLDWRLYAQPTWIYCVCSEWAISPHPVTYKEPL